MKRKLGPVITHWVLTRPFFHPPDPRGVRGWLTDIRRRRSRDVYGVPSKESAREPFQPAVTHPGDHISTEAIGDAVAFLQQIIPAPHPLDPGEQIWPWKEFGTAVGFIGMILFLFAFAEWLLTTPHFAGLVQPMPEHPGGRGAMWWIGAAVAAAIPAITFFKFQHWGNTLIPTTAFWPQSLTIGFVAWALGNRLIALVLFLIWHYTLGKRMGGNPLMYGLSTDSSRPTFAWRAIGKAFLLACATVLGAYALLALVHWLFLADSAGGSWPSSR